MATDGGGRSGFATLRVHVADENDNPPMFVYKEYKAVIYSNHTPGTAFLKLRALDEDDNQNAAIIYSLYDAQNSGVHELFKIDASSGVLALRKSAKKWG